MSVLFCGSLFVHWVRSLPEVHLRVCSNKLLFWLSHVSCHILLLKIFIYFALTVTPLKQDILEGMRTVALKLEFGMHHNQIFERYCIYFLLWQIWSYFFLVPHQRFGSQNSSISWSVFPLILLCEQNRSGTFYRPFWRDYKGGKQMQRWHDGLAGNQLELV